MGARAGAVPHRAHLRPAEVAAGHPRGVAGKSLDARGCGLPDGAGSAPVPLTLAEFARRIVAGPAFRVSRRSLAVGRRAALPRLPLVGAGRPPAVLPGAGALWEGQRIRGRRTAGGAGVSLTGVRARLPLAVRDPGRRL